MTGGPRALPLDWVLAQLPSPGPVSVAVLARDDVDLAPLRAALPAGSTVSGHRLDGDLDRLHEDLAALGRHDVVVDLGQGPRTALRVPLVLPHVRRGGRLLVLLPRAAPARAAFEAQLDDARALRASGELDPPARGHDPRTQPERERHALAASMADATVTGDRLVVTAGVVTWSVVREARFDGLLERHPRVGRVRGAARRWWPATAAAACSTSRSPPARRPSSPSPPTTTRWPTSGCSPPCTVTR